MSLVTNRDVADSYMDSHYRQAYARYKLQAPAGKSVVSFEVFKQRFGTDVRAGVTQLATSYNAALAATASAATHSPQTLQADEPDLAQILQKTAAADAATVSAAKDKLINLVNTECNAINTAQLSNDESVRRARWLAERVSESLKQLPTEERLVVMSQINTVMQATATNMVLRSNAKQPAAVIADPLQRAILQAGGSIKVDRPEKLNDRNEFLRVTLAHVQSLLPRITSQNGGGGAAAAAAAAAYVWMFSPNVLTPQTRHAWESMNSASRDRFLGNYIIAESGVGAQRDCVRTLSGDTYRMDMSAQAVYAVNSEADPSLSLSESMTSKSAYTLGIALGKPLNVAVGSNSSVTLMLLPISTELKDSPPPPVVVQYNAALGVDEELMESDAEFALLLAEAPIDPRTSRLIARAVKVSNETTSGWIKRSTLPELDGRKKRLETAATDMNTLRFSDNSTGRVKFLAKRAYDRVTRALTILNQAITLREQQQHGSLMHFDTDLDSPMSGAADFMDSDAVLDLMLTEAGIDPAQRQKVKDAVALAKATTKKWLAKQGKAELVDRKQTLSLLRSDMRGFQSSIYSSDALKKIAKKAETRLSAAIELTQAAIVALEAGADAPLRPVPGLIPLAMLSGSAVSFPGPEQPSADCVDAALTLMDVGARYDNKSTRVAALKLAPKFWSVYGRRTPSDTREDGTTLINPYIVFVQRHALDECETFVRNMVSELKDTKPDMNATRIRARLALVASKPSVYQQIVATVAKAVVSTSDLAAPAAWPTAIMSAFDAGEQNLFSFTTNSGVNIQVVRRQGSFELYTVYGTNKSYISRVKDGDWKNTLNGVVVFTDCIPGLPLSSLAADIAAINISNA